MDLVCVGLTHKKCPVEVREKTAFSQSLLSQALIQMGEIEGLREWFVLSTCNRVELYGRGFSGIEESLINFLSEFHGLEGCSYRSYLDHYHGREVAHHLFQVASGLDSLVVGENEIYGQIKQAFKLANEHKALDSILYQLVE